MTTEPRNYPFSPADRLHLDPFYAALREHEPVSRVRLPYGDDAWLVTRYEDAKFVLSHPRFSRAASARRDEPRTNPHQQSFGIIAMDPPDHTRLRTLVAKTFTARRVEQLRSRTAQLASDLVDRMAQRVADEGGPGELVDEFSMPLPVVVICDLLGVPAEDRADFEHWSEAFTSTTKLSREEIENYGARMYGYMGELIAERRDDPQDDLISALIAAHSDQGRITEDELMMLAVAILVAGHETTGSQISNFVYLLLRHPRLLRELRDDLDLVPSAVEELLRHIPLGTSSVFPRYATEDVEVGDVLVREGEPVLVSLPAANRDTAVFAEPEHLVLDRQDNAHVTFGHGPHHCLGAQLARMELQVAVRTLLERLPGLRLAVPEADVEWKTGLLVRGPLALPLEWDETVPEPN